MIPEDIVAEISRETHFALKELRKANLSKKTYEMFKEAFEDAWYRDVKPYLWR